MQDESILGDHEPPTRAARTDTEIVFFTIPCTERRLIEQPNFIEHAAPHQQTEAVKEPNLDPGPSGVFGNCPSEVIEGDANGQVVLRPVVAVQNARNRLPGGKIAERPHDSNVLLATEQISHSIKPTVGYFGVAVEEDHQRG